GLRFAHERLLIRKRVREGMKAPVGIDIIDDHRAASGQSRPDAVEFEANVRLAVQTVVNEQVDVTEPRKQAREMASARSREECPSVSKAIADCDSDLALVFGFFLRTVDARETTAAIALE